VSAAERATARGRFVLALVVVVLFAGPATSAHARDRFDVDLFARVPDPGQPEGIAVDSKGTVFVGTSPKEGGPTGARRPSKVFAYNGKGKLKREYVIGGQDLDEPFYGLLGMAFDGDDLLYALDAAPPRVVRLDPRTGAQSEYARFRDVPPCSAERTQDCSDTVADMGSFPDYPVFAPDGTMYVTDLMQALIWRVPPGGGRPEVWFTDNGFETLFGPNGIQFMADGKTLLFVLSNQSSPTSNPQRTSGLYQLLVGPDGTPGQLEQIWEAGPADVPDGFALARSGNAYVALAGTTGNAVAVVSPQGEEIARTPATEIENQQMEVPFDQPASAAFLGERVLVTNHSLFARNPDHYAVLDVFADEPGLPLLRPRITAAPPGGGDGDPSDGQDAGGGGGGGGPGDTDQDSEAVRGLAAGEAGSASASGVDDHDGELPFTGLSIFLALAAGAALLASGLGLRMITRARPSR
jgi:sugar lactone lactonase YvrE